MELGAHPKGGFLSKGPKGYEDPLAQPGCEDPLAQFGDLGFFSDSFLKGEIIGKIQRSFVKRFIYCDYLAG